MQNSKVKIKSKNFRSINLNKNSDFGFTLIELLIVVAIIGILSTLLMVNFIGIRQRARDAQRKAHLRQIQSSLELYRADVGSYPTNDNSKQLNGTNCPTSSSLINGETTYMQKIPCDPLGITVYNSGNYYYYSNGTTYTLAVCLENAGDNDQDATSTSPDASVTGCTTKNADGSTGYYYVLQNP